jgi:peptidoglycan/xylan/chitin deacetylase (PgdA/CDA1 family)
MNKTLSMLGILLLLGFLGGRPDHSGGRAPEVPPGDSLPRFHIYLSFDDGPLEGSEDIDDAVRQENIPVNVFVVGQHAQARRRMRKYFRLYQANPLIEIGNHSFSHAHDRYQQFYENPGLVLQDFLKNQQALGITGLLARLPGRNMWRLRGIRLNDVSSGAAAADSLYAHGFRVFGWDLEWQHDAKTGVPVQTVNDMKEKIGLLLKEGKTVSHDQLVLLAHDEMFRNGWEESELKSLILLLKADGHYQFDHLSSYPEP